MLLRPMRDTLRAQDAWIWAQRWLDVLFLHWRVPEPKIQPHLAPGLEADTFDGDAWLSVVLFRLHVRPRWLPFLPGLSVLAEMNLRTYVRHGERSGIFFLSIHADNPVSAWLARWLTPLPYHACPMTYRREGEDLAFRSSGVRALDLRVRVVGPPRPCGDGTLDDWLLERYRAFACSRRAGLVAGEVTHPPWAIQDVELLSIAVADATGWGRVLGRTPDAAHFGGSVEARFGPFRHEPSRIESSRSQEEREATA